METILRRVGFSSPWLPSCFFALALAIFLPASLAGQAPAAAEKLPPGQLVREAVANEVAAAASPSRKHMFRSVKKSPRGSQTKLYVETSDAVAGMVIAYNDTPLAPQQLEGEAARLDGLANNPQQLRHKHAQEKEDAERTLRIVRALPDAFLYEYAGEEEGTGQVGKPGDPLVRLNFRPDPAYEPPSRVEQLLSGMKGHLLIDANLHRIARIDGTLFKEVSFGWGILCHLEKGGHFLVEQADIGDGSWDITRMNLRFTGKVLLFKGLNIESDEVLSDFRPVEPDLTFAQGVKLLRQEQARLLQDGQGGTPLAKKAPR